MIIDHRKLLTDIEFRNMYKQYTAYTPSTTTLWEDSDTEKNFKKNLRIPEFAEKLRAGGWTENNIQYRFNSSGFRSDDEFNIEDPAPGNIFLGCSITAGIGLNIEDTWGYKISKQQGGAFYNISQGGCGLETYYRFLKFWAPLLRPKKIFTIGAFAVRREFFKQDRLVMVGLWSTGKDKNLANNFFSSKREISIHELRTWDAIRMVAQDVGAEIYAPTIPTIEQASRIPNNNTARDLIHMGVEFHNYIASSNFEKIS